MRVQILKLIERLKVGENDVEILRYMQTIYVPSYL